MGGCAPGCLYDSVSVNLWAEVCEELMNNYVRPYGFKLMILALRGPLFRQCLYGRKVSRGLQLGKKVGSDFLRMLSWVFFPLVILTEDYTFITSVPW